LKAGRTASHPERIHANGRDAQFQGLLAEAVDVLRTGLGLQEGVIDEGREIEGEWEISRKDFRAPFGAA
jgi:hypothetical protein